MILLSFFATAGAASQTNGSLPRGVLVDSVVCLATPDQSYALYLPSYYVSDKNWPIIYAFDPVARGALPVKLLQDAAEKYGYIVVGSNTSRNGPWQFEFDAANALSRDTQTRFSLDQSRLYTTGFSGGSRVASAIAILTGKIAGVVGCGAGLATQDRLQERTRFAYAGIIGNGDMNYVEMHALERKLDKLQFPHKLIIFDGGHQWPPEETLLQAVEWLELEAMRQNAKPIDKELVARLFSEESNRAEEFAKRNQPFEAYKVYSEIASDFKGLWDLDAIDQTWARLRDLKAVKEGLKRQKEIEQEETRYQNKFAKAFRSVDVDAFYRSGRLKEQDWWEKEVNALYEKLETSEDEQERLMLRRIIDRIWRNCAEQTSLFFEKNGITKSLLYVEIWKIILPDYPTPYYGLARVHALNGDTEKAVKAIHEAVALGLKNADMIEHDPYLESLRTEKEFRKIISNLRESK